MANDVDRKAARASSATAIRPARRSGRRRSRMRSTWLVLRVCNSPAGRRPQARTTVRSFYVPAMAIRGSICRSRASRRRCPCRSHPLRSIPRSSKRTPLCDCRPALRTVACPRPPSLTSMPPTTRLRSARPVARRPGLDPRLRLLRGRRAAPTVTWPTGGGRRGTGAIRGTCTRRRGRCCRVGAVRVRIWLRTPRMPQPRATRTVAGPPLPPRHRSGPALAKAARRGAGRRRLRRTRKGMRGRPRRSWQRGERRREARGTVHTRGKRAPRRSRNRSRLGRHGGSWARPACCHHCQYFRP